MTIDGRPFFDQMLTEYVLEAPVVRFEANRIGTLTFTIYPSHPEYDSIVCRQSVIRVYRDGAIYCLFRPIKRKKALQGGIEYTCEELTGLLNDFLHRPESFPVVEGQNTARDLMQLCVAEYNAKRAGGQIVAPEEYILGLWEAWDESIFYNIGGRCVVTYFDYSTQESTTYDYSSPPNDGTLYLNSILAVLGYYGNVYLPPTRQYDNETCYRFAQVHNLRYGHGIVRDPITLEIIGQYDGVGWGDMLVDVDGFVDALHDELEALVESMQEEDGEGNEGESSGGTSVNITFSVGQTPASGEEITLEAGGYDGYWDYMQSSIIEQFGGYIIPEWGENSCTLHYKKDEDLTVCSQAITFSENMADMFIENDSEKVYSIIIPLGKNNITISTDPVEPDYIGDATAVGLYGYKEITKEWPEIDDAQKLKSVASQWLLENAVRLKDEFTVEAYDLKYAGVNTDYLDFLMAVPVRYSAMGISQNCTLTAMENQLDIPTYGTYTLNGEKDSLVDKVEK